ncbi:MAG: hypothetical protein HDQ96_04750 [Lachnospiraceae bacterium]|nr:hypothetical protein [Lachnospiraceae bacterium]
MKLEELLSKELFEQVKAAIDAANAKEPDKLKHIRYTDLSEGNYVSKEKYTALETDKGSISEQLKTAQDLIKELKKGTGNDEGLQEKIKGYETTIDTLQKQMQQEKLDAAVKIALLEADCKDVDYITFKLKEKGELSLDEHGKVKGMEDKLAALKTQFPDQFVSNKSTKVNENRLPESDGDRIGEPKDLAEALKMQYEENNE